MTTFLRRLAGLLLLVATGYCTSCAHGDELADVLSQPVDSTIQHQVASQLHARNIKIKGLVTIQLGGTGNLATTTDAAKARAPVAAAPHATATQTKTAGLPWQMYALGVIVILVAGAVIGHKLLL